MKYCNKCGSPVTAKIPPGDHIARCICTACGTIHYENPKVIAGCLVHWKDQVLLCRRAIDPRRGYWTIPAGFMENGETALQAAIRETFEEAGASVEVMGLYAFFSPTFINEVYLVFRGQLVDRHFQAGIESMDVCLFEESDIPWNKLSYPVIGAVLRNFFSDQKQGCFSMHVLDEKELA